MSRYDDWLSYDAEYERLMAEQEAIDARVEQLLEDRSAVEAAGKHIEGTIDYDGLENALADLSEMAPEKIIGSDALAFLLRKGQQASALRLERLTEIAEQDVARDAEWRPDDLEDVA